MWVAVVVALVGSLVTAEIGRRAAAGTLPRNHLAGIRVPATLADDASWHTAHRAGGPTMRAAGLLGAGLSLAAGVAGTAAGDGAAAALLMGAAAALVAGVVLSARRGLRALG